ncbi:GNAT family N-acetyltransferase [Streptomyces sp. NPDC050636]|uniref:GNAT family N-acetyltransferase n=1 Tax=Streptomyces sp. NPDC050636 TaxID=3154510 RepID=UPI00341376BE
MSFPEAATPPQLRAQVRDLQQEAWPSTAPAGHGGAQLTHDHDPALQPLSMLLVANGTVLAALDILSKPIVHAGRRYRAGGLSTVVTRQAARGQGYGRRLVTAAHDAMAASGLDLDLDRHRHRHRHLDLGLDLDLDWDLGVFTCDRPLQSFYESAGWHRLPGTVLTGGTPQNPFPSDQPGFDKVTMADFFSDRARKERLAFHHTRIELFPGEIDKLW